MIRLKGARGDGASPFDVILEKEATLGRSKQSKIPLVSLYISRSHCKFEKENNVWYLTDLKSFNGTYLNGERLPPHKRSAIKYGDKIRLSFPVQGDDCCFELQVMKPSNANEKSIEVKKEKINEKPNVSIVTSTPKTKTPDTENVIVIQDNAVDSCFDPVVESPRRTKILETKRAKDLKMHYLKQKLARSANDNFNKNKTKTGGLKKQVAASYGNRIPIPGGGSARVIPSTNKPEITILSTKPKQPGSVQPAPKIKIEKDESKKSSLDIDCINLVGDAPTVKRQPVPTNVSNRSNRVTSLVESIIAAQKNNVNIKPGQTNRPKTTISKVSEEPSVSDTTKSAESGAASKSTETGSVSKPVPNKRPVPESVPNKATNPSKKVKISDGGIAQMIAEKRSKHDNITVSPMKPLGPPPTTSKKTNQIPQPTSSVLQNHISLLPKELQVKNFSTDNVLLKILEWSVQWIRESKTLSNKPPPITDKPLIKLSLSYSSWQKYYDTYEPLVLHEIWSQIMQSYESEKQSNVLMVAVSSYELIDGFLKLDCQATMLPSDFRDQLYLNEGDLALVELQSESCEKRVVFGYIETMISEDITDRTPILRTYRVPPGHRIFLKYQIKIKFRQVKLDCASLMRVRSIYYLKPLLRNIEAILALQNSKLCEDILSPRMVTCQMAVPSIKFSNPDYNESQLKAILASVEAVQRPYTMPKLLMIQGPPGTGKTTTLVGIIKKIFETWEESNSPPKVLVCAPSNGAIDEIARRLHSARHFLTSTQWKRPLRCVRVGMPNQMHPSVRKMSLDELVTENISRQKSDHQRGIQEKIDNLERDVACKDRLVADYRAKNDKNNVDRCLSEMFICNREIEFLRKELKNNNEQMNDINKKKSLRADILKKADVVLSTLNSCRQSLLEGLYLTDRDPCQFNCVIIDEASQCCEPEILMPLTYTSISKMILIGDPMQLPATVISPVASEYHYDRSLFERFFHHFGGYSSSSPVLMLDTQYRMHSSICSFPSKKFYSNRLKTAPDLDKRPFPLKPYLIIDLKGTTFDQSNFKNIHNELEADFVINLYSAVREICHRDTTVGIITPYQGQKKLLSNKLEKNYPNVDVNTIDGFQGQERDVIIISLVRDFSKRDCGIGFLGSANRLNVALTRARHSLIICISDISDVNNDLWKSLVDNAASRKLLLKTSCRVKNGLKNLIKAE
uniref:FHA domain-containing protein n=2 Tax=Tetranychus urticae TaxID=32264 RepID=T1L4Q6_TETUR